MASELSTAVSPAGAQSLSNLIANEQANRSLGIQAMGLNNNMALAQQQLALEQQRMGMMQDEAERERQHQIGMSQMGFNQAKELSSQEAGQRMSEQDARQKFDAAQMNAFQQWEAKKTAKQNALNVQLEMLRSKRAEALQAGMVDAAEHYANLIGGVTRQKAHEASTLAMARLSLGKTQQEIDAMQDNMADTLGRKQQAMQMEIDLANRHVSPHIGGETMQDIDGDLSAFDKFYKEQNTGAYGWNPLNSNYTDLRQQLQSGELSGLEFLKLDPTSMSRITGMFDPTHTMQGRAVVGESDAKEMSDVLSSRASKSTLASLQRMGIKNLNVEAAGKSLDSLFKGGADKSTVLSELTQAGVPLTTLKQLLGGAAGHYETIGEGSAYGELNKRLMMASTEAGGQVSIKTAALKKAMEAHKAKASIYRTAYNMFDMPDTKDLQYVLDNLKRVRETGRLSSALQDPLERYGFGSEYQALRQKMADLEANKQAMAQSAVGLGNTAEAEEAMRARAPIEMQRGLLEGQKGYNQDLAGLLERLQGEANQ